MRRRRALVEAWAPVSWLVVKGHQGFTDVRASEFVDGRFVGISDNEDLRLLDVWNVGV